jgi:hypothetical protein
MSSTLPCEVENKAVLDTFAHVSRSFPSVQTIDYKDDHFPVHASCLTGSKPNVFSSRETGYSSEIKT